MPRTPTRKTDVLITPYTVTATTPIKDRNHHRQQRQQPSTVLNAVITLSEILTTEQSHHVQSYYKKREPPLQIVTFKRDLPLFEKNNDPSKKKRDISRTNSAYLRIIVAEINMMRTEKIVCPLRHRGSLPPRIDLFQSSLPSPLKRYSTI
ncbi:uncharacterized protein BX663DRAFT_518202 [Cokeromyces recurvatus]|uniref:uncharacterized protein n=1 Tax=Cokeromyces recurvatus TaxID=90255 RepID=UPI00221EA63C|nr:uncharacterized protein BX663DRAFT_518202 [Cokeromyces recurvatus]KAI7900299.1 hypothetical protein BX663DRAFT_518202 [Cokeromyces recurvatus]